MQQGEDVFYFDQITVQKSKRANVLLIIQQLSLRDSEKNLLNASVRLFEVVQCYRFWKGYKLIKKKSFLFNPHLPNIATL